MKNTPTTLKRNIFFFLPVVCALLALVLPSSALAQDPLADSFVPLTRLPGLLPGQGIADLINNLFLLSIAVGAVLAVIMISIGGLKYMASGSNFTSVGDAREMMLNAVIGLVLILATFIIFNTINDRIVANLDLSNSLYRGQIVEEGLGERFLASGERFACGADEGAARTAAGCTNDAPATQSSRSCSGGVSGWIITNCRTSASIFDDTPEERSFEEVDGREDQVKTPIVEAHQDGVGTCQDLNSIVGHIGPDNPLNRLCPAGYQYTSHRFDGNQCQVTCTRQ